MFLASELLLLVLDGTLLHHLRVFIVNRHRLRVGGMYRWSYAGAGDLDAIGVRRNGVCAIGNADDR